MPGEPGPSYADFQQSSPAAPSPFDHQKQVELRKGITHGCMEAQGDNSFASKVFTDPCLSRTMSQVERCKGITHGYMEA